MKQSEIIKLSSTYNTNGFTFDEVKRIGDVCHYVSQVGCSKDEKTVEIHEVFYIQKIPERQLRKYFYRAHEAVPNNEKFGYYGWSFTDRTSATRKFNELTNTFSK
jgi:hypothetical protein